MIMTTTTTITTSTTTTTIFIVSLTAMTGLFGCVSSANKVEVCNLETQLLNCSRNDVIYINSSRIGRMSKGKCLTTSDQTGCSADAILYLEHKCAGRRQCSVSVDKILDSSPHGCHPDLKIYLEIVYSCIPVESPRTNCSNSPYVIHPKESSGYLAHITTSETRIGSSSCPWVIEAKSGQTLALTLLDFGIWRLANQSSDGRQMCQIYMTIADRIGSGLPTKVCGGTQKEDRRKSVYSTNTNSLQITMNNQGDIQFVVKYEVLGCPDLSPTPPHSSVDRHGDRLTVRCEAGKGAGAGAGLESVVLTCVDGNWTGPALVNCSMLLPPSKDPSPGGGPSFGGVLMVVIVVAVVFVVILVAIVTTFVLWRYRFLKRQRSAEIAAATLPLPENYHLIPTPACFDPSSFPAGSPQYALTPSTAPTMLAGGLPLLHDGSRRPSADLLQIDYSTLQARGQGRGRGRHHPGAMPKGLGHSASLSSFRQMPGIGASPYAETPGYNGVNTMLVYCPYHGTITRVHGGQPHHHHHHDHGDPGDCAGHPLSHSHGDMAGRYGGNDGGDDGGGGGGVDQLSPSVIYQELDPNLIAPDTSC